MIDENRINRYITAFDPQSENLIAKVSLTKSQFDMVRKALLQNDHDPMYDSYGIGIDIITDLVAAFGICLPFGQFDYYLETDLG